MSLLETFAVAVIPVALIGPSLYFLGVQTGASRESARRGADVDRLLGIGASLRLAARCYESACGLDHRVDTPCKGMPGWRKRRSVS